MTVELLCHKCGNRVEAREQLFERGHVLLCFACKDTPIQPQQVVDISKANEPTQFKPPG
jgi:hypothetical protein